jgi:hypothetical protein
VSLEQRCQNVTLPKGDESEGFVVQCLVSMVVLSLHFGAINNHPIPQKFSILRLEVAKNVTWWGRCIRYPSLAAKLQRLVVAMRLGNDKSSNLEALTVYFNW